MTKGTLERDDFLLELWVEEIPAGYIKKAIPQLEALFAKYLREKKISFDSISVFGAPNRLVVCAKGIPALIPKEKNLVFGPPEKMLYDEHGSFTVQAKGFAKKYNTVPDRIKIASGKASLEITTGGEKTRLILAKILPEIIGKIEFPKTMVWEETLFRFARPIRNILALLGQEVVRFRIAGINSSNKTVGLHVYSDKRIPVNNAAGYFQKARLNCIIIDPVEREDIILKLSGQILKKYKAKILGDEGLIEEICFLTENPVAVLGSFKKEFLDIPESVLMSCLKDKQKFIPVVDDKGKLMNLFIGFRNGKSEYQDIVREGYERVLEARLRDMQFFFNKDKKTRLEEKVEGLKGVVQNEQLGSLYRKTERTAKLACIIADKLSFSENEKEMTRRAALLAKADLVSEMVFEYPELQGIMGGIYARIDGEPDAVSDAISEHYLPGQIGDAVPGSRPGCAVALADKFDSLCSSFVLGYTPKGSGDPYGLRRMALGAISIILENGYKIPLRSILQPCIAELPAGLREKNAKTFENTLDFIKQRFFVYLSGRGFDYDLIEAILSSYAWDDNLIDTNTRLDVLREVRADDNFEPFILLYRRAANILKQARQKGIEFKDKFDESRLVENEEKALWLKCSEYEKDYKDFLNKKDYKNLFFKLLDFKAVLNNYFDKVLVMVDDETLKGNRLALLERFNGYFIPLADFSKIVLKGEETSR